MEVNPLVFETNASTNSAIWASLREPSVELVYFSIAMQRYGFFLILQMFGRFFSKKICFPSFYGLFCYICRVKTVETSV